MFQKTPLLHVFFPVVIKLASDEAPAFALLLQSGFDDGVSITDPTVTCLSYPATREACAHGASVSRFLLNALPALLRPQQPTCGVRVVRSLAPPSADFHRFIKYRVTVIHDRDAVA